MSRTAVIVGVIAISVAASSALAARSLETLQSPGPNETAARPDSSFAASCRAAARELLGQGDFTFQPPAYSARDGEPIVRLDVGLRGVPAEGLFRAVCVRDRRTGAVEAAIFDAPADGIGPRVISLGGPQAPARGAAPSGDSVISFNYSGPGADIRYGGVSWGAWSAFPTAGPFDGRGVRGHRHRHKDALEFHGNLDRLPRFVAPKHRGTGFKGSFGGGTRMGVGAFIR